jgi:hypothetical protein
MGDVVYMDLKANIFLLVFIGLFFLVPIISFFPVLAYPVDAQATFTYVQYGGCFDYYGNPAPC